MLPNQTLITPITPARLFSGDLSIPLYLSLLKLILHLALNAQGGYGLFRDEFYYLACTNHLAAGYVDQPPLSIFLLKLNVMIFGDSLFAIRLIPALCAALTVWFTGLITLRIGGGRMAVLVACLLTFSPGNLVMASFYSMNGIEILSWVIAAYILITIIQTGNKNYWILLGIVLGLGLLNKIGVLFLGAGIFAGLLFTRERKWLATPWPYISGVIAFVLFMPFVIWNIQHDYAHLEFIKNASSQKYSGLSIIDFLSGQFLLNNPVAILIWLPGLLALLFADYFKEYRILAYLYLIPLLILLLNKTSKDVYLLPGYSILWAAGGVWVDRMVQRYRYAKIALMGFAGLWLALTLLVLPMVLPVLPVNDFISYSKWLGTAPSSAEGKELAELPQFYADMFGWEEKAKSVSAVYHSLSDEEKKITAIFSNNYGRCGSLDYYGKAYGLPKTIGSHNNYWMWGPRGYTGEVVIILGGREEEHKMAFESVERKAVSTCTYCMPYENNVPVFLCRGIKGELAVLWQNIKNYN